MYFLSDNCAGAHPEITASLSKHAGGYAASYGSSDLDLAVQRRFSEIFEREVAVFYTATGTASNSLALTSLAKPGGVVFAHQEAHVIVDECGAPEYISGQLRIAPVPGRDGRMDAKLLRKQVERLAVKDVHAGRPCAVTVTQANEGGTVYSLDELDQIAAVAKDYRLPFHMDGARFANALVALGCTPAEMTWKRGVDILSFGATKNGCWCAEAVVLFDPSKAEDFSFIHKRSAQLFSKSRFISAQFEAYFANNLWLDLARHSNSMAAQLAEAIAGSNSTVRLLHKPQGNEIFVILKKETALAATAGGARFYEWPTPSGLELAEDEQLIRFVTSFSTTAEDLRNLFKLLW